VSEREGERENGAREEVLGPWGKPKAAGQGHTHGDRGSAPKDAALFRELVALFPKKCALRHVICGSLLTADF